MQLFLPHKGCSPLRNLPTSLCVMVVFVLILVGCHSQTRFDEKGWQLVWNDEFDGASIDLSKWSHEVNCYGGGNSEAQCYTANAGNSYVANGSLHIVAIKEQYSGPADKDDHPNYDADDKSVTKDYTSARLRTLGKGDWRYGRFEVRAKFPKGQGTWGAAWMLPTDWVYGEWASSGEIDIVEAVNLGTVSDEYLASHKQTQARLLETRIHGTLHYGKEWPDNVYSGQSYRLVGHENPADGFHVYAIEWEQGEIRWYMDGKHYATQTAQGWYSEPVTGVLAENDAPFNQHFHFIVNLAVGGDWAGTVNEKGVDASIFPQAFEIDYVRVYRCSVAVETGKGCADIQEDAVMVEGKFDEREF